MYPVFPCRLANTSRSLSECDMEIYIQSVPIELRSQCQHAVESSYSSLVGGETIQIKINETLQAGSHALEFSLHSGHPQSFFANGQIQHESFVPISYHAVITALRNLSLWGRYEIAPSVTASDVIELCQY
jgi:hypothetical protein